MSATAPDSARTVTVYQSGARFWMDLSYFTFIERKLLVAVFLFQTDRN